MPSFTLNFHKRLPIVLPTVAESITELLSITIKLSTGSAIPPKRLLLDKSPRRNFL
jgi:hypothetical protein